MRIRRIAAAVSAVAVALTMLSACGTTAATSAPTTAATGAAHKPLTLEQRALSANADWLGSLYAPAFMERWSLAGVEARVLSSATDRLRRNLRKKGAAADWAREIEHERMPFPVDGSRVRVHDGSTLVSQSISANVNQFRDALDVSGVLRIRCVMDGPAAEGHPPLVLNAFAFFIADWVLGRDGKLRLDGWGIDPFTVGVTPMDGGQQLPVRLGYIQMPV